MKENEKEKKFKIVFIKNVKDVIHGYIGFTSFILRIQGI